MPFASSATIYAGLVPGDCVLFDSKRWIIDELTWGDNYLHLKTTYDRQSAYTSDLQAILGNDPNPSIPPIIGPTTLMVMNLPALQSQDSAGVYIAASGALTPWPGCQVQVSYDNQATWQIVTSIYIASVMGHVSEDEALTSNGPQEPITVIVNDTLEDATSDQIAANANAFAIIATDGTPEIGQFETATLNSHGEYELTGLVRGGLNTPDVQHFAGEQFTMLENVYLYPIDTSFSGKTLYFRGVTFGQTDDEAPIVPIVYSPDMQIVIDGGHA